jgi:hypothetical protein
MIFRDSANWRFYFLKLEQHVLKAIEAFCRGDKNEALMHATFSIEGTARKYFSNTDSGKKTYKECLRQYWWIIERFIGEGFNLEETKFTHLNLVDGKGKTISNPDFSDIVYHVFRCNHAHAKDVPIIFNLSPINKTWIFDRINSGLQMPEDIIWALLAVSVFCKANADIQTQGEHFLSWGGGNRIHTEFKIKDYWGKENKLKEFFSDKPINRVKIEGL